MGFIFARRRRREKVGFPDLLCCFSSSSSTTGYGVVTRTHSDATKVKVNLLRSSFASRCLSRCPPDLLDASRLSEPLFPPPSLYRYRSPADHASKFSPTTSTTTIRPKSTTLPLASSLDPPFRNDTSRSSTLPPPLAPTLVEDLHFPRRSHPLPKGAARRRSRLIERRKDRRRRRLSTLVQSVLSPLFLPFLTRPRSEALLNPSRVSRI